MTSRERVARALLQIREEKLAFSIGTTIKLWEEVPQWHNELLDDSDAAIAAYEAALAEEGMVIVPREATKVMIDAGRDVGPDAPYGVSETAERWRAMIAAWLAERG